MFHSRIEPLTIFIRVCLCRQFRNRWEISRPAANSQSVSLLSADFRLFFRSLQWITSLPPRGVGGGDVKIRVACNFPIGIYEHDGVTRKAVDRSATKGKTTVAGVSSGNYTNTQINLPGVNLTRKHWRNSDEFSFRPDIDGAPSQSNTCAVHERLTRISAFLTTANGFN